VKVELVREKPTQSGAILSRVFVDGSFFGYGLENNLYKIPSGRFDLYGKYSPSLKANKVYIAVPGRSNIMFHGGNTHEQTKGCVIVAANRSGETVSGDLSQKLYDIIDAAGRAGEPVGLIVKNSNTTLFVVIGVLGAAGLLYYLIKR
jgi:hypothetical protein